MNRFARLVGLRSIREEAEGLVYARILAKVEGLRQSVVDLDLQTKEERDEARLQIGQGLGLSSEFIENFLKGQAWRRQRLQESIATLQEELSQAREVWHAARVQLKQAEKLSQKDDVRQQKEIEKNEMKSLDMIGVLQATHFLGRETTL